MNDKHNVLENIYAEIWELFKYLDVEFLMKIPSSVLNEIKNHKNDLWNYKYDIKKNLEDQQILEETKDYLSILFYKYFCNNEEKKELFEQWIKNSKKQ